MRSLIIATVMASEILLRKGNISSYAVSAEQNGEANQAIVRLKEKNKLKT